MLRSGHFNKVILQWVIPILWQQLFPNCQQIRDVGSPVNRFNYKLINKVRLESVLTFCKGLTPKESSVRASSVTLGVFEKETGSTRYTQFKEPNKPYLYDKAMQYLLPLLFLCFLLDATASQSYYKRLGLKPQATDKEIKKAYRKMAMKVIFSFSSATHSIS